MDRASNGMGKATTVKRRDYHSWISEHKLRMRWWSGSVWVLLIVLISAAASGAGGLQVDPCAQWYQLRQVLTDLLSSGPANSGRGEMTDRESLSSGCLLQ